MSSPGLRSRTVTYARSNRILLLIAGVYFLLAFVIGVLYAPANDEVRHLVRAEFILDHGRFAYDDATFDSATQYSYPPVFHLLSAAARYVTGYYEVAPALSGAVAVFFTGRLATRWSGDRFGVLAALALATHPFFLLWGARMYVGTTITAGFLLTFALYYAYRDTGNRRYLYATFLVGGALAAVKTYGPAAAGIVLFHALLTAEEPLETLRACLAPLAAGVVASLPWPIRNLVVAGSPLPRVLGDTGGVNLGSHGSPALVHYVLPRPMEVGHFLVHSVGIYPPSLITTRLAGLSPILGILWFVVPLSVLGVAVSGARSIPDRRLIGLWTLTITALYLVIRVLSGTAASFKFRHFVTLVPLLAVGLAYAYREFGKPSQWKRVAAVVVACGLLVQMGGAAAVYSAHTTTQWGPAVEWVEGNVDEDETIFYAEPTALSYRVDDRYRVVSLSTRDGQVDPNRPPQRAFASVDYVLIKDFAGHAEHNEFVRRAAEAGALERVTTIDAHREVTIAGREVATLGRTWTVYRVTGTSETVSTSDRRIEQGGSDAGSRPAA